jgi:hypothetical protein
MSSGGARSRSGPPPDPNSGRGEKRAWTDLPASGRSGDAPDWPLTEPTPRERVLWARWWRKPEALIWERDGSEDYVALTVRMFAEAEVERASAENRKTVRMMMADLYLTRDAKDRAGFRVIDDEIAAKAAERETQKPASSRDRLKVVKADGA